MTRPPRPQARNAIIAALIRQSSPIAVLTYVQAHDMVPTALRLLAHTQRPMLQIHTAATHLEADGHLWP